MKRKLAVLLTGVMCVGMFTACGSSTSASDGSESADAAESAAPETISGDITVVSREDGSGTRGAFIELFGIEEKDDSGEKVDMTTEEASITNNTSVMMTTVAGDTNAIGYISLGSLDDSVKAVKIDGAEASVENVKNDTYKVSRPFNIVTGDSISEVAQDFIDFIMSTDGQAIVEENGYIPLDATEAYAGTTPEGKVVVAGSSSVSPVMEKLKEAYLAVNANADIEVQTSDSTTGVQSTIEGICDIGMASRDLKDEEASEGITSTVIAKDGIAVIVNNGNAADDLTSDQVKSIFTGETTTWDELAK
ncbi:MAG: substrate-binding domain-containing protein [Lachnospiraceae bacterium]|nr:substrate-binding domain-containing protein [Lachnospiraceae bacterium]MDD3616552.1 substrate-binding domain-containing protein [Lachnospiraceae bacterium]